MHCRVEVGSDVVEVISEDGGCKLEGEYQRLCRDLQMYCK
jgi:hypothetical protein